MTEEYKKVNLNMIMLNLALIVDSENEFAWFIDISYFRGISYSSIKIKYIHFTIINNTNSHEE